MIIESVKAGFELTKKDLGSAVLYGFLLSIVEFLGLIPVIGPFVFAWLYPKVLRDFGRKHELVEKEVDLKPAFLGLLIPSLIANLGFVAIVLIALKGVLSGGVPTSFEGFIKFIVFQAIVPFIVLMIVVAVINLLVLYTVYGNIVGKVESFSIDIRKSVSLFIVSLLIGFIAGIVGWILGYVPTVGELISLVLSIVLFKPWQALALMYCAKSS